MLLENIKEIYMYYRYIYSIYVEKTVQSKNDENFMQAKLLEVDPSLAPHRWWAFWIVPSRSQAGDWLLTEQRVEADWGALQTVGRKAPRSKARSSEGESS